MNNDKKGLKTTTIWLMVGVALLFDAVQILFSWFGGGWLLIPIQYGTFILWFKLQGISFLSMKRAPSLVIGGFVETLTAGIFPAFTAVVARVAFTSKIQQAEARVVGSISPKDGDSTEQKKAA